MKSDDSVAGQTVHLTITHSQLSVSPSCRSTATQVDDRQEKWMPISMQPQMMPGRQWLENPNANWIHMIGRLRPGTGLALSRSAHPAVTAHAISVRRALRPVAAAHSGSVMPVIDETAGHPAF